jgi:hypothetical protein
MTRRKQFSTGAAVKTICTTLFALALSSSPAFAEYRAWFAPWDYVGDFQPGDISEDFSEMVPPDEACGLRISTPSYYAWTDDVDGVVASHDLYQDVIIWVDNPGADCTESFSVTKADKSATYSPPDGAVSMEIHTNYGAYWVNKNGYYLYTCGGGEKCVGADDFTIPPQDIWSTLTASAFADVSGSTIDPRRQTRTFSAVADLALRVGQLRTQLQNRIATRRRTPLGGLELSVRSLEDAATRTLATARTSADSCAALVQKGFYLESFAACTRAGRAVEESDSLMRAAWFLYHPPSLQTTAGR